MTIKPEIVQYVQSRAPELGKNRRSILVNEVKEKFSTIISERTVYNILKNVDFSDNHSTKNVDKSISELQTFLDRKGITVKDLSKFFYHQETNQDNIHNHEIDGVEDVFKLGVVSDTHLGAKTCALEELHDFYNHCSEEGITDIVHAGDLCDGGGKVYPGQLGELKVFGYDDMLEYTATHYPKIQGITTHFILGNHDEDFLKHGGANFGKALSALRDDLNYLGFYDATIIINGVKIGLHHGAGGGSYAKSYKLQKHVETLTGDMKPQIYILGHYHDAIYMTIRNIHCLLGGSFQKHNNFAVRLNLGSTVGGYILEIHKTKDNSIRKIVPEFVQYYF